MQLDLVQRRHAVPGADLAGVHRVVAEILVGDGPVLKAHQPVAGHHIWIKVHLYLGVHGDGLQRARQAVHKEPLRLGQGVDVGIEPVAIVGQLLHQHVVIVAHAKADAGHGDPLAGIAADHLPDRAGTRAAHICHPVGAEDHAVDAPRLEGPVGPLVAQVQPRLGVGRSLGLQAPDGIQDGRLVLAAGRLQHDPRVAAIDHNAHRIVGPQLLHQQLQRALDQPQPVLLAHRARDVDDKGQHGVLAVLVVDAHALDADAQQVVLGASEL